jgi:hypothetical protein
MFQLFRHKTRLWGKTRRNIKAPTRSPQITVWSGISTRGSTPLIFIEGSVDTQKYIEILEKDLIKTMDNLYTDGYIFQQDNAPIHKSRTAKKWFADIGLVVKDWLPMSPDLSPIENLWGIIKTMKPMSMSQ